ncbi:MAG: hypothetical protein U5R06_01530 [candidate division KSB1 bacterium]|nr:hypothetical protein [candidate division KSB1 bacterium]
MFRIVVLILGIVSLLSFGAEKVMIDEKQTADLKRARFNSWLLTLPLMLFIFILQLQNLDGPLSIHWLPIYIFSSLILFSGFSLLYYKRG